MSYSIIRVREYFGPKTTWDYARDERGDEIEFEAIADASAWIAAQAESDRYFANGEATTPTYYIIGEAVRYWLDDPDGGKYDWPDSVEEQSAICSNMQPPDKYNPKPYACGQCESCLAWMAEQDLKYIVAHAEKGV